MIAAYRRDGFVLLPGFAGAAECGELLEGFRRALAIRGEDGVEHETDRDGGTIMDRLPFPTVEVPELAGCGFLERGARVAETLLGAGAERLECALIFIRKPAGGVATQWHQHTANPRPPHLAEDVTLWMALEDTAADDGCLRVVPGSHLGPTRPHDERLCIDPASIPPADVRLLPMARGDAVAIHERLIHGAEPNRSTRSRVAISLYGFTTRAEHSPATGRRG